MKMKKLIAAVMAVILSLSGQSSVTVFAEETAPAETEKTAEKTEEAEASEGAEDEETSAEEETDETEEPVETEEEKEEESAAEEREEPQRDVLKKELTDAGKVFLENGDTAADLYSELNWKSHKDELPKHFDLREDDKHAEDQEVHLLPSPAGVSADGKYKYIEAGTEAFKMELLEGRIVTVGYHADHSTPVSDAASDRLNSIYKLKDIKGVEDDAKLLYAEYALGNKNPYSLTVEEVQNLIKVRLALEELGEDLYELKDLTRDELADLLTSRAFGKPLEEVEKAGEESEQYINVSGTECTWAHYTYTDGVEADETVTIVGWDDDYAKENFLSGHQPSANGAWIVKSSFDEEWGMDGYFYLSYYDKSISHPVSYGEECSELPETALNSTCFESSVSAAKVLTFEEDSVLEEINVVTGELNTLVTAYVYLLDEDAETPTDGVLLDCVSETFTFAGWHSLPLHLNVLVDKDSCISVVTVQSVSNGGKTKYVLVNTAACVDTDLVSEEVEEAPETAAAKPEPEGKEEAAEEETSEADENTEETVEAEEAEEVKDAETTAEETDELSEASEEAEETEEKTDESEEEPADETVEETEEPEETWMNGVTYISYGEDVWYVWCEETAQMQKDNEVMSQLVYEELPIQVFTAAFKDVEKEHSFGEPMAFFGGHALICGDCGYLLVKGN